MSGIAAIWKLVVMGLHLMQGVECQGARGGQRTSGETSILQRDTRVCGGGAGLLEKPIRGTHGFRLQMLRPCSLIENSADSFVFQLGEAKGGAGRLREAPPSHC